MASRRRRKRTLRITSWNVEGLGHHLGPSPRRSALHDLAERLGAPDVLCLQEVRLRERDAGDLVLAAEALPGFSLTMSLADDPQNARFRGGRTYGVATYARSALGPAALERESWDREGRVTTVLLPEANLAVVNVYAVNGTAKPYWDHELGAFAGDRHAWKRRFHERVAALGRSLKARGHDLLLIGDWNVTQERIDTTPRLRTEEPHATSRRHFRETVVEGLDVVDVFRALHPEARAYTWFNRFARTRLDAARVDYALLSRSRLDGVVRATIDEALVHELGSDHAPLHIELAT